MFTESRNTAFSRGFLTWQIWEQNARLHPQFPVLHF
jgi:hypothetical protein